MNHHRNTSTIPSSKFKILISGYINVNVIDGSAFFLSGISAMCARQPNVSVTLVSANPIARTEVLEEILPLPNVEVVDPFQKSDLPFLKVPSVGESMSREEYAHTIGIVALAREVDAILIRDTETAYLFSKIFPDLNKKMALYVTGISSSDSQPASATIHQIEHIVNNGSKLLCQTTEMAEILAHSTDSVQYEEIGILSPHVPDSDGDFEELFHDSPNPNKLAYTGKFFKAWNADGILAGFKHIQKFNPNLQLDVAGDQFKRESEDIYFVDNVNYLLRTTPGVVWHGRVPRIKSREIITEAHVGIGWRSPELDSSTELSTKILEYGALARPSILNRTKLHEELLGKDYPLFVNSISEYKNLLTNLENMSQEITEAAKRCYNLAQNYTYSAVLPTLISFFHTPEITDKELAVPLSGDIHSKLLHYGKDLQDRSEARIEGMWFILSPSPSAPHTLGELALEAENSFNTWQTLLTRLLSRSRISLSQQREDRTSEDTLLRSTQENVEESHKIQRALEQEKLRANELQTKVDQLEKELHNRKARLEALSKSKLGKIQLLIWKKRSGK